MQYQRNRKYPVQYKKIIEENNEKAIDLSAGTAAGIVAAFFIGGLISGWMIKRHLD